jgi:hypothetical protein
LPDVSSPQRKNISLYQKYESSVSSDPSRAVRGAYALSSRNVVRDAMDAAARETSAAGADGEIVWS